jgi:hypothetical protein
MAVTVHTVLFALLTTLLLQEAQPQVTERTASVEGVVVRAGTSQPIAGATVELTGIAPRIVEGSFSARRGVLSASVLETASDGRILSFTATTSADGTFQIMNVPPGSNYQLIAVHPPQYLPAQYGQRVPAVPGRPLSLAAGEQRRDVRIEMTPSGAISGRVVDSRGLPMRNVVVELRRPWYLEGWRLLLEWNQLVNRLRGIGKTNRAATMATNARGEFNFSGLAPAQYYIRTSFTDEESLAPINLHAGASITDLRIVAPELSERDIQGVILAPDGTVAASARVAVLRPSVVPLYETALLDSQALRSRSRGQFTLTVPGPGRYLLVAAGETANGEVMQAREEVDVRESGLRDVRMQLRPPFRMSGRVTFEGNVPRSSSASDAMVLELYPMTVTIGAVAPAVLPTTNGAFTLQGVTAGDYRVEVRPILTIPPSAFVPPSLERAYVKSIRLDGKDVLNSGLHLESPTNAAIEVVISMNGGTLAGHVLDAARNPVPNVNAVVVPNAPRRRRGDLYKYVATDDSGNFQLTGLAPGDYKLFAWERVEEGAWQDPEFIRLFEDSGSPVRIEENRRTTEDAKLILAWN